MDVPQKRFLSQVEIDLLITLRSVPSFSEAAIALKMTQSAVSRAVTVSKSHDANSKASAETRRVNPDAIVRTATGPEAPMLAFSRFFGCRQFIWKGWKRGRGNRLQRAHPIRSSVMPLA